MVSLALQQQCRMEAVSVRGLKNFLTEKAAEPHLSGTLGSLTHLADG